MDSLDLIAQYLEEKGIYTKRLSPPLLRVCTTGMTHIWIVGKGPARIMIWGYGNWVTKPPWDLHNPGSLSSIEKYLRDLIAYTNR